MKQTSIRRALLLRCGLGIGLLLLVLCAGIYIQVRRGLYRELDGSIRQAAALLANQIEYENGRIIFEWQEGAGDSGHLLSGTLFEYWNETTGETIRSPALGGGDQLPGFCGPGGKPEFRDILMPGSNRHARAIGMRVYPFVVPEEMERMRATGTIVDPKSMPHLLVVARDAKPVHRILTRVRWILAGGTLSTLAIGYLMMELAIRASLRPIHDLTREIRSRSGKPEETQAGFPHDLPMELTGLVEDFEALLGRVSALRERERDFIRHAAHELRTPIAGLLATTDLALSKTRDAAAYAQHLETCAKTARELAELVKRLASLARIGKSSAPPRTVPINIASVMDGCLARFDDPLRRRGLGIQQLPMPPGLRVIGDEALCRIILNNLLDNVASYAPVGTMIGVGYEIRNGNAEISVSNEAELRGEDPERWFEPLFRDETSRHDAGAHLGIGLTLSRDAAHAMGGDLGVRRTGDGRISFILTLPLAGDEAGVSRKP